MTQLDEVILDYELNLLRELTECFPQAFGSDVDQCAH